MSKKPTDSPAGNLPVPIEMIQRRIYLIRSQKVMLDSDLAELESFRGSFTVIGDEVASKIVFICSDMWEPYLKVGSVADVG